MCVQQAGGARVMEPFLGCQCYDSAVTGAWQVTGGSDWGMELSIVQCVHGSKQTEQTQQAEKIKIKKQIPPRTTKNVLWKVREESRLGDQCLSTDEVRCGGFPLSLCSSLSSPCCLLSSPLFHPVLSLCGSHRASRCHLLICLLGEVSVRWRSWTIPAHFPLERGSSPFVFQSGLGQALPAASWPASRILARSLTAALSLLCFSLFFFFFFPLLLLSPRLWKSSSDFPGLLSGEKDGGTFTPPPTSAFPVLPDVETPRWGDGVSSRLYRPCALGGSTSTLPPSLRLPRVQEVTSQQHRVVPREPGGSCGAVPWRSHVLSRRQTLSLQTLSVFPLSWNPLFI